MLLISRVFIHIFHTCKYDFNFLLSLKTKGVIYMKSYIRISGFCSGLKCFTEVICHIFRFLNFLCLYHTTRSLFSECQWLIFQELEAKQFLQARFCVAQALTCEQNLVANTTMSQPFEMRSHCRTVWKLGWRHSLQMIDEPKQRCGTERYLPIKSAECASGRQYLM